MMLTKKVMPQYAGEYDEELLIKQYETIRKSRACNMFNYPCVQETAFDFGMEELGTFIEEEGRKGYRILLQNFSALCTKYEIQR